MQNNLSCWFEEQKFEKSIQNLLDHLIIFLFGSQKILEHLDEIRVANLNSDSLSSADCGNEHDTLENDIIFSETINQVVVDEVQEVGSLDGLLPLVSRDVDHGTEELK